MNIAARAARPVVQLQKDFALDCAAALEIVAGLPGVYQRSDRLITVTREDAGAAARQRGEEGPPKLVVISKPELRAQLSAAAEWQEQFRDPVHERDEEGNAATRCARRAI